MRIPSYKTLLNQTQYHLISKHEIADETVNKREVAVETVENVEINLEEEFVQQIFEFVIIKKNKRCIRRNQNEECEPSVSSWFV